MKMTLYCILGFLAVISACKQRNSTQKSEAKTMYDSEMFGPHRKTLGPITDKEGRKVLVTCEVKNAYDELVSQFNGKTQDEITAGVRARKECKLLSANVQKVYFFSPFDISVFNQWCDQYLRKEGLLPNLAKYNVLPIYSDTELSPKYYDEERLSNEEALLKTCFQAKAN